jgi:hypothetical protein
MKNSEGKCLWVVVVIEEDEELMKLSLGCDVCVKKMKMKVYVS